MLHSLFFLIVAVVVGLSYAQTLTTTDLNGDTIVEIVTSDALGNPLTSTIQTIATAVVPTTTTTTTPAQVVQQGPVGQPAATTFSAGGPTPYTYTTVIDGVPTAVVDTFVPTNPSTTPPTVGASGTIWDYSSWLAIYGPTSSASAGANSAPSKHDIPLGLISALSFGFAVGVALVRP